MLDKKKVTVRAYQHVNIAITGHLNLRKGIWYHDDTNLRACLIHLLLGNSNQKCLGQLRFRLLTSLGIHW
jgi:hypothetical protein